MISSRIIYLNTTYPEYISNVVSFAKFSPEKRIYIHVYLFADESSDLYHTHTLINYYFFFNFIIKYIDN